MSVDHIQSSENWKAFKLILAGETVSNFGTQLALLAIPTYAINYLNASPASVSTIYMSQWLPPVLMAMIAGYVADKFNKLIIIVFADIGCMLITACIAVLIFTQSLNLSSLLILVFLAAGFGTFYSMAADALTPILLKKDDLAKGNSHLSAVSAVAQFFGHIAAARFVHIASGGLVMLIDAMTFGVRAILVNRIRKSHSILNSPQKFIEEKSILRTDLIEAIVLFKKNPVLLKLIGAQAIYNTGGAVILGFFLVFAYNDLALKPYHIGVMLALGSASAFISSVAFGKYTKKSYLMKTAGISLVISVSSVWLVFFSAFGHPFIVLLIYQLFFSVASSIFFISTTTLRQDVTPMAMQGRVASISLFLNYLALISGSLITMVLAFFVSNTMGIIIGASLSSVTLIWFFLIERTYKSPLPSILVIKRKRNK